MGLVRLVVNDEKVKFAQEVTFAVFGNLLSNCETDFQIVEFVYDGTWSGAVTGNVPLAAGLGGVSTAWTIKNDGLGIASGVGGVTTVAGAVAPFPISIYIAIGQVIYDFF